MIPAAGAETRAEHLATLRRIQFGLLVDSEMGRLLDELAPIAESLDHDSDDASLIRLCRREYDKAVRVPVDLRAEMARSAARARTVWVKARAESDFASFLPALEHNFDLRLRYIECFDSFDEPYDILLDDFEPQTTTTEVRATFDELKPELRALIDELGGNDVDDSFLSGDFPVERQRALAHDVVRLFGLRPETWRLDPTEHPFASGAGVDDVRITTNY